MTTYGYELLHKTCQKPFHHYLMLNERLQSHNNNYTPLIEGQFLFDQLVAHLEAYSASRVVSISEDATRVILRVEYDQTKDELVAAEKMKTKYNKNKRMKIVRFSIGDYVTVKVPRLDRRPCDLRRLPGVIVKRNRDCYKIRTKYSALKRCGKPVVVIVCTELIL